MAIVSSFNEIRVQANIALPFVQTIQVISLSGDFAEVFSNISYYMFCSYCNILHKYNSKSYMTYMRYYKRSKLSVARL